MMFRRALSVPRAPWPRVAASTACGPRSPWKHHPHSILVDQRLATGGSLSEASTIPAFFQLRWRADNTRGGSSRGKRGRGATSKQRSGPDFRTCQSVSELVNLAHSNHDSMNNRAISAFWSALPRLIHKHGDQDPDLEEKLSEILGCSLDQIRGFSSRDLAQTSLGLAKTIGSLTKGNRRYSREDPRRVLRELLAANEAQLYIFEVIEVAALPILGEFDARRLSNLIYSFGLVKYNPTFDVSKKTLFDALASTAIDKLAMFNGQDISNMLLAFVYVESKNSRLFEETGKALLGLDLGGFTEQALANILWSFAKLGEADPELFQAIGNHIVARSIDDFWPQALSNVVWAYATAGVSHPELFKKIGDHTVGLSSLDSFDAQALSNTAWAFATAGVSHPGLFKKIGDHVAGLNRLDPFKTQALSNTAWAFAAAGVPHPELFSKIGHHVAGLKSLDSFEPQNLSNTAWAYATAGVSHPELFKKIGDHVVGLNSLDSFHPQNLSNTAWAYATAGVSHAEVFKKIGGHVAGLDSLDSFNPQDLSNTAWAFATAGESHSELFKKIGDHVARLGRIDSFNPQDLSNTAWAFATAGVSHPELFKKIGDHVVGLDSLDSFHPQFLSNTAWAYATARWFHSRLFKKLSIEAVINREHFNEQDVANFFWACATVGHTDKRLFSAFAPVVGSKLDECNEQDLTNIAWAYSCANVPSQDLFNECFVSKCVSKEFAFSEENLRQLHQWQLWRQELKSGMELPQSLRERCRNAFISSGYSESKFQNDVVRELKAVGLAVDEEVLLGSGCRVDALVKVGDRDVAIEVDGPSHFIQRRPTGSTTLKHRQVATLDCIAVVSVPYWEWGELKNSVAKQHYLIEKLGCDKDH